MGKLQTTIVAGGRLDCKHSLADGLFSV